MYPWYFYLPVIAIGSILGNTYIDDSDLELNRKKAIKYLNGIGYSFFALTIRYSIDNNNTTYIYD